MTVRIIHQPGVGLWAYGAVVDLPDRRAQGLIHDGYAVAVVEKPKSPKGAKE